MSRVHGGSSEPLHLLINSAGIMANPLTRFVLTSFLQPFSGVLNRRFDPTGIIGGASALFIMLYDAIGMIVGFPSVVVGPTMGLARVLTASCTLSSQSCGVNRSTPLLADVV